MVSKPKPTFADFMVAALSPTLIIGLIGSLVFFLVEILYAGWHSGALLWTLFFFVVGIVLVARISIQSDPYRAGVYGMGLAVVSWLAMQAYIEYPRESDIAKFAGVINLCLMVIVWWCAHKLTWNCTYIDEKRPVSGKGLLSAAGLDQRSDTQGQIRDDDLRAQIEKLEKLPFSKRWQRFRERRKIRPQTPGLTVLWFSLAALPIFGLGESLIPADNPDRRAYVFWLAACYVGCALGLLLATSFLGLRRYLRQRKLEMPAGLTSVWLGLGGALAIVFLIIGALLPRPYSETPIADFRKLASKERNASKNAVAPLSPGKGESESGTRSAPKAGEANNDETANGKKGGQGKSTSGEKEAGRDGDAKGGQSPNGKKDDQSEARSGRTKDGQGSDSKQGENAKGANPSPKDRAANEQQNERKQGQDNRDAPNPENQSSEKPLGGVLDKLLGFLKWLVFILIALLVLAFLVRGGLKYLANFMPGPRKWLAALSAWWERLWRKPAKNDSSAATSVKKKERRPFAWFSNPFANGASEGRSLPELIGFSFAALEAWAADRNQGRRVDETPLEFAARLENTFPSLHGEAQKLAILVVRLAYANGTLPADAREILDHFWNRLTTTMPAAVEQIVR